MHKTKKGFKAALLGLVTVAAIALSVFAFGCGSKQAEGSVKIGTYKTAGNGCVAKEILNMLNSSTDVSLKIDGENYTFTKILKSDVKGENSHVAAILNEDCEIKYTFTGTVTSSEKDKYVLAPAEYCEYSIKWTAAVRGMVANMLPADHNEDKTGNSEDNAESLKWFYSPYVKKADDNSKSMTVTVKDGGLVFEGFDISDSVED